MRREERKKTPCDKACIRKTAVLFLMAALAVCSGCTKKEELVFSIQNESSDGEKAEEGADSEPQVQTAFAEVTGTGANEVISGDDQASGVSDAANVTVVGAQTYQQQEICVHVCGAVKNPGVYTLPAGSRVYEAVQAAGGFSEDADESYVNQAWQLPDAVQLVIPTVGQVAALDQGDGQADAGMIDADGYSETSRIGIISQGDPVQTDTTASPGEASAAGDGKININTASESQLCNIPGIGATRAAAITAYRQEYGAFETIEDIMKVSGIKQGTYDKIKDSITVK